MTSQLPSESAQSTRILISAAEAFPDMERAFLAAKKEIWASFRVFNLWTKLRSDEAKAIGKTWFDLIVHILRRGVKINMALSDFDAVMAPDLHCETWESVRAFIAAQEVAGPDAPLTMLAAAHPARVGRPHRVLLWPLVRKELVKTVNKLNEMDPDARERRLQCLPGLRNLISRNKDGKVRAKHWPPADLLPVTHHQKIAVFDRKLLCIGGLDLDERRYDDKGHHRRRDETWHDVQLMSSDEICVREAQEHLEKFLAVTNGSCDPPKTERLLATLSRKRRMTTPFIGPRTLSDTIARAHIRRIHEAKRLIYLETQFFRDVRIATALAEAAKANPDLGLIMVLPGAPETVAFDDNPSVYARYGEHLQVKAIEKVRSAFVERAVFCSPVRPERLETQGRDTLAGSPIIYVHAKVSIFDDDRAIVSSANLNGRSMAWDTEAGIEVDGKEVVARLRKRVCAHWMDRDDCDPEFLPLDTAVSTWRRRAESNLSANPDQREGFLVPYDLEAARKMTRRLPGIPKEMV